jgi:hypothetical protein
MTPSLCTALKQWMASVNILEPMNKEDRNLFILLRDQINTKRREKRRSYRMNENLKRIDEKIKSELEQKKLAEVARVRAEFTKAYQEK